MTTFETLAASYQAAAASNYAEMDEMRDYVAAHPEHAYLLTCNAFNDRMIWQAINAKSAMHYLELALYAKNTGCN